MSGKFRQFKEVDWTTNWEEVWKYTKLYPILHKWIISFLIELVHKELVQPMQIFPWTEVH